VIVLIPAPQHHTHLPQPFIFLTSPAGRPDARIPFTIHQISIHQNHPQRESALEEEEDERSMLKDAGLKESLRRVMEWMVGPEIERKRK